MVDSRLTTSEGSPRRDAGVRYFMRGIERMTHAYVEQVSRRRWFAVLFSLACISLVGIPIIQNFREKPDDGFPLSYYPMFSEERHGTTQLSHAIGIRADGTTMSLHYRVVGSGGMNQVRRQIRKIVRSGDADELCRKVAAHVAQSRRTEYGELVEVAIVTDTYDFHEFFGSRRTPRRRLIVARCPVDRSKND